MNGRYGRGHSLSRLTRTGFVLSVIAVSLSVLACEQAVSSALGLTSVEASDGTYSDRVEVSWDTVTDTDASGNARTVQEYTVTRSPATTFPPVTETTYTDTSVAPGVSYTYSVTAEFTDGATKAVDLSDTGYAMDATELQVYSSPNDGTVSYDASSDAEWFNFLGQEGWLYRATVTGSAAVDVYREGNIGTALSSVSETGGVFRYRLPRSGRYHLRVNGAAGTVSVSHE